MRSGGGAHALTPRATGAAGRGPGEQDSLFEAPAAAGPTSSGPDRDSAARAFGLRTTSGFEVAEELPVARVRLVGVLPHLDRLFEYAVTPQTAEIGRASCRGGAAGRACAGTVLR